MGGGSVAGGSNARSSNAGGPSATMENGTGCLGCSVRSGLSVGLVIPVVLPLLFARPLTRLQGISTCVRSSWAIQLLGMSSPFPNTYKLNLRRASTNEPRDYFQQSSGIGTECFNSRFVLFTLSLFKRNEPEPRLAGHVNLCSGKCSIPRAGE